ncbi:hypothetical protein Tco_1119022, partial [Tanacetum coccineum]
TRAVIKEIAKDRGSDKGGSTEELVSTAIPEIVSTARQDVNAARQEISAVKPKIPSTTTSIFDDEEITMAQTLITMKEEKAKEKGVAIKEVEESDRPARSILTLKPLLTIDPKDKGKGVLKESPVKKVKNSDLDAAQIAKDAEVARLVYKEELVELERVKEERQRQEQAFVDYIANLYDEVQAKMDASEELAARLQMEEREMYIVEERSRLLAEYFENRKKQLTAERSAAIRNKPLTRTQLRSLMMAFLKHTDFVHIGSENDERMIEKMNKKEAGVDEEELQTDSDLKEEEQLKAFLVIVPDEEGEIDYEVLDKRYPIVDCEYKFYHTDRYGKPHDYYRVLRADGSSRYIKTFTEMVSSLRTMFEANAEDDLLKNQEEWILKSWNFYDNCRVHILVLEDGTEFYMLVEKRYPLIKETLERMLALRLIAESESEAVFDLLRFIQKKIDEFGSHDGSEKDL